jgi:hypothetical protein
VEIEGGANLARWCSNTSYPRNLTTRNPSELEIHLKLQLVLEVKTCSRTSVLFQIPGEECIRFDILPAQDEKGTTLNEIGGFKFAG